MTKKKDKLPNDSYWNKKRTKWRQPPVKIQFGDLVDINYKGLNILGRYIGNGIGAAIVFVPHGQIVTGFVTGRGIDRNPKLLSDKELLETLKDTK